MQTCLSGFGAERDHIYVFQCEFLEARRPIRDGMHFIETIDWCTQRTKNLQTPCLLRKYFVLKGNRTEQASRPLFLGMDLFYFIYTATFLLDFSSYFLVRIDVWKLHDRECCHFCSSLVKSEPAWPRADEFETGSKQVLLLNDCCQEHPSEALRWNCHFLRVMQLASSVPFPCHSAVISSSFNQVLHWTHAVVTGLCQWSLFCFAHFCAGA